MALEVQVGVEIVDTLDGERIYSCRRTETVAPARLSNAPDPDAIVPLLKAATARLGEEATKHVLEQLEAGSEMIKGQFGG